MYTYRARLVRVVDRDTIDVDVDLGFHLTRRTRLRLLDIDTPERGQEGYYEAKEALSALLDSDLVIFTEKGDSFGRWLATVYRSTEFAFYRREDNKDITYSLHNSVNAQMLETKYVKEWKK